MKQTGKSEPHILILFSDTGGGHRSAAEAIVEALDLEFPACFTTEMVDFFKDYAPPPFNAAPISYSYMAEFPNMWGLGYRLSNNPRRIRAMANIIWPYIRRDAYQLVENHPCDLYLSVHPIINGLLLNALADQEKPYITVVTDLVSTHAFWFNKKADLVIVPTEPARQNGLSLGLLPDQIKTMGLPVSNRFCQPVGNKTNLRKKLGWQADKPVVLVVAGGDGMGPMQPTADAINASGLDVSLILVAGRNARLKSRLEAISWNIPVKIYGFITQMPDFMRASDFLITKAGPGTISEAFIAGLPIILYSHMPGQEDGNIDYVVKEGAGVWAPGPDLVVAALRQWLTNPIAKTEAEEACRRLAKPDAARQIAHTIAKLTGIAKNHTFDNAGLKA